MKQYFYSLDGKQLGPVPESELRSLFASGRITSSTLVWTQGMVQWQPYGNVMPFGNGTNGMAKPDNGLVGAVPATLFCCLPLGVVAIVKACNVDTLWNTGNYQAAIETAKSAKSWAFWSFASIVLLLLFYGVLFVMIASH